MKKHPLSIIWVPEYRTPKPKELVFIAGTLCNEINPSVHEGFWDGRAWRSVRDAGDGLRTLRIENVTAWMQKPDSPTSHSMKEKSPTSVMKKAKTLFLVALGGLLAHRLVFHVSKIGQVVRNYILLLAEPEPEDNKMAHRLNALIRSGASQLNEQKFCLVISTLAAMGYKHPWDGCQEDQLLPNLPLYLVVKQAAQDARLFPTDADIYDWLLYEVYGTARADGFGLKIISRQEWSALQNQMLARFGVSAKK